ncbi:TPA: DUF4231 domain-containing protein [Staphylococcus aureus]|nr:DUF4231 domain-containing protein [Staphylococcus aureus]HDD1101332.1 DUF4231 domain-containing protein [Staphylococcus aureus]HDE5123274.1 DUF4231 domain-containing protein [Staphylococcus aureus]HDZ3290480.1 DUF4231 domain-containing protein [Staphylococcus aureus]HEA6094363.1 DUF4231 domain-containing protein [Staphylococcus aureus]
MEDYLSERLEDQIKWYDNKSMSCQKFYNLNKYIQIVSGALIPALTPFSLVFESILLTIILSILGLMIVISQSISHIKKFHENYIHYRTTCEALKHEKYLFLFNVEPYDNEKQPLKLLVTRVESIISNENINWQTMRQDIKEEEKC